MTTVSKEQADPLATMAAEINANTVREQQQEIARLRGVITVLTRCVNFDQLCTGCKRIAREALAK